MSWLSKIFGGSVSSSSSGSAEPEAIEYESFLIYPDPIPEGTAFRVAARIEKEIDGEVKSHHLIRADVLGGFDAASEVSVTKAKQMIKEQGVRLFD